MLRHSSTDQAKKQLSDAYTSSHRVRHHAMASMANRPVRASQRTILPRYIQTIRYLTTTVMSPSAGHTWQLTCWSVRRTGINRSDMHSPHRSSTRFTWPKSPGFSQRNNASFYCGPDIGEKRPTRIISKKRSKVCPVVAPLANVDHHGIVAPPLPCLPPLIFFLGCEPAPSLLASCVPIVLHLSRPFICYATPITPPMMPIPRRATTPPQILYAPATSSRMSH